MSSRVLTGISFVFAVAFGWFIFGPSGSTVHALTHVGFLASLGVFLASLIAELRPHILSSLRHDGDSRPSDDRGAPRHRPGQYGPQDTAERVKNDSMTHRRGYGRLPG